MENTRKKLIEKINMKGISKFKKDDLLRLYNVKELSWNDLRRTARGEGVKAKKKIDLQNGLISKYLVDIRGEQWGGKRRRGERRRQREREKREAEEEERRKIEEMEERLEEEEAEEMETAQVARIKQALRDERVVRADGTIIQHPFIDTESTMTELGENEDAMYFSDNFREFMQTMYDEIFENDEILSINFQALVAYTEATTPQRAVSFMYTEIDALDRTNGIDTAELALRYDRTELTKMFVGYKVFPRVAIAGQVPSEDLLNRLVAYHPTSNPEYHKLTIKSTSQNSICIYETYMYLCEKLKITKHTEHKKKLKREKAHKCEYCDHRFNHPKRLKKHQKRKCINYMLHHEPKEIQEAVKSGLLIQSLELLTKKYNNKVIINFFHMRIKGNEIIGDAPIIVDKGETTQIKELEQIKRLEGKKCFLYEKNVHVAPAKFKIIYQTDKKEKKFILRMNEIKGRKELISGIYGFHIRKWKDKHRNYKPLHITMYGNNFYEDFLGNNCVKEFVNYLKENCTKIDNSKTKRHKKTKFIYIYGFNNSKVDNILIYNEFHNIDPNTKYIFTNNGILYIKYNNVRIYDVGQYYNIKDDLYQTAKEFKLKRMKPCKLIYLMAQDFIKDSKGTIKGKAYNYMKCPTTSSIALKLYSQVFQKKNLVESPLDINEMEKRAYYGGKCAVYKKRYIQDNDMLYYADINSCHASKMKYEMPYVYYRKMKYKNMVMKKEYIVPYNLYVCNVEYIGNNEYYIPNIIHRVEKNILEFKNVYNVERYGCELIEAIENGCKVTISKEIMYKPQVIFSDFVDYIYSQRLKHSNNKAKKLFYKKILVGLYGKLGQKKYNKSGLFNSKEELDTKLSEEGVKLVDWKIINNKYMAEYKDNSNYDVGKLVRFPAYITALVRCEVSKAMRAVGHENVYYSSTDSLFSTKKLPDAFLHDTELGKWKTETRNIKNAVFLAPNTYYVGYDNEDKLKASGINKDKLRADDYNRVINGQKVYVEDDLIFRNFERIQARTQKRTLNHNYNRRKWEENNSRAFENIEEYYNLYKIPLPEKEPEKEYKPMFKHSMYKKGFKGKYAHFMFDLDDDE
jgi:hypothetical protein